MVSDKLTDEQIAEGLRLAGEVDAFYFWPDDFDDVWQLSTSHYLAHAGTHYAAALREVQALRQQVKDVIEERDKLAQFHGGHLPECAGMDMEQMRCGCGYFDGTAYRELVAQVQTLTEERDRLAKGLVSLVEETGEWRQQGRR